MDGFEWGTQHPGSEGRYPLPLPFWVIFLVFIGLAALIWAKFLILLLPSPNFFE